MKDLLLVGIDRISYIFYLLLIEFHFMNLYVKFANMQVLVLSLNVNKLQKVTYPASINFTLLDLSSAQRFEIHSRSIESVKSFSHDSNRRDSN